MKVLTRIMSLLTGILFLLASCHNNRTQQSLDSGDTIPLKYARLITLIQQDSFQIAILQNPWQPSKILHRYVLVDKNLPLPQSLPEGCTVIRTPVNRAVVYSSVHYSLLELLKATNCIDGVCDAEYILNASLQEKIQKGEIRE